MRKMILCVCVLTMPLLLFGDESDTLADISRWDQEQQFSSLVPSRQFMNADSSNQTNRQFNIMTEKLPQWSNMHELPESYGKFMINRQTKEYTYIALSAHKSSDGAIRFGYQVIPTGYFQKGKGIIYKGS